MADVATPTPEVDPSQRHLVEVVVPDGDPLPDDPAELARLAESEFGVDAPAMQELFAQVDGLDPLTGEALAPDPEGGAQPPATEPDPAPGTPGEGSPPQITVADPADPSPPSGGGEGEGKQPAAGADPAPTPEGGTAEDPAAQADPAGVATADGKHVIPYSVLQTTREQNNQLRARIEELEAARVQPAPPVPGTTEPTPDPGVAERAAAAAQEAARRAEVNEAVAKVESEFGEEAAKPYRTILEENGQLRDRLARVEERFVADDGRQFRDLQSQIQTAIDQVPAMADWQADAEAARAGDTTKSAHMWELVMANDAVLQRSAEWQGRPRVERYQHVAKMLGGGDAPASGAPNPSQEPGGGTPAPTPEQQAAAQRAVDRSAGPGVTSLTDLPGSAPTQTDGQQYETMDAMELTDAFDGMSTAAIEELLARTA